MPHRLFILSRTQPARTIVGAVAFITFLAGLFIFTPWYVPTHLSPAASAVSDFGPWIGGSINTLVCIPAIYAVWKNTTRLVARAAFVLFGWYMFVTMTRITFGDDPLNLLWVPSLLVAVVMSVIYLEQSQYKGRDG